MSAQHTPAEQRAAWLAGLRVGDKIAWLQHGRVRSVHTLLRETPKHFAISDDGWLVSKKSGCSTNIISGVFFVPYEKGMEERIARRQRAEDREAERSELIARISRFSNKRLRAIAKATS